MKSYPSFLLLGCSQRKHATPSQLPALERYAGPQFQVLHKWLHTHSMQDMQVDIAILSARFGLLTSTDLIPAYDQHMTPARAAELRPQIMARLKELLSQKPYRRICISLGRDYRRAIENLDALIPSSSEVTWVQGTQGRRLALLYEWLYQDDHLQEIRRVPPRGRARLQGVEIALSPDQVLARARQALTNADGSPLPPTTWYVEVDGRRVGPKWLVSQLTGLPVSAFHSLEARRVLMQLGIQVNRQ